MGCIAWVFLLLCPTPAASNALQKNLAFCTDEKYLLLSVKALTSCLVLSADAGLYGCTVWHSSLLLYFQVMCLLFLLWSYTLLCNFIVCFTAGPAWKQICLRGAIKIAIELKQGHKNAWCISNSASVYGAKYQQQFFTQTQNITMLLQFTSTCNTLVLLAKVLFSTLYTYFCFFCNKWINKLLKNFITIHFYIHLSTW